MSADQLEASSRRVYLVRHGDVSYFDPQGRPFPPNAVPLNEDGLRQAEALGEFFRDVPLDRAVSSDLPRSIQTAEGALGGRTAPAVETMTALREIQPGRLADVAPADLKRVFVDAFTTNMDRSTTFLGGETFGALLDRVRPCFAALLAEPNWRHLLILAHGGVNRVLLGQALGLGLAGFAALEQDPGCVNILDIDATGRFVVRLVNHTPDDPSKRTWVLTTMERLYRQMIDPRRGTAGR
ncbi:MAG: histidine phosphatase family protein [Planctomycetes bacterium]|nr:histidine phosphatase family protein [Planctomycetota bacterium]